MSEPQRMILLAHDGSVDADAAIDHVAWLAPGAHVTVLTVWRSGLAARAAVAAGAGIGAGRTYAAGEDIEIREATAASALAAAGAERAVAAGLHACPRCEHVDGDVATTILRVGAEVGAAVIAVGRRGGGRVRSLVLGSVSAAVVRGAGRGVLIVAAGAVPARRHERPPSADEPPRILIGYDGSRDAAAAIGDVARLTPGAVATIVTVWESVQAELGVVALVADMRRIDVELRTAALALAATGADLARAAGLTADPRCAPCHGDPATTILTMGTALDVDLVVVGTRGRSGLKAVLLGSVSTGVLAAADRPVLVVPAPAAGASS